MQHAWIIAIIMGLIYHATGRFVARWPETLSGYSTMSAERRKYVDIQAAGRCVARFLYAAGYVACAGAAASVPGLPERWGHRIFAGSVFVLPVALILFAAVWSSWKYDRKFMTRFRK